jgi:hypothetical protein
MPLTKRILRAFCVYSLPPTPNPFPPPAPATSYFFLMIFDLYWRVLGLPWSRLKGAITDAVPYSLVEITLWIGTTATLVLIFSLLPVKWFGKCGDLGGRLRTRGVRIGALGAGPVLLITLGLGQGAFPGSLAPTAWRTPLAHRLAPDTLPEAAFNAWVAEREARLRAALSPDDGGAERWHAFQTMTEREVLALCDTSLDAVLAALALPGGRTVRTFKNMGPWTATIGLAYGGPAFHDPFFGEIAIISDADMPAPHFWRLSAACHEAAHAKGFTREMDTEILTQLALARLTDPRLHILADLHFLRKTGTKITWPDSLIAESNRVRARRAEVERGQPVVRALRTLARKLGLQNSATKYGARTATDSWNPLHPFFATVHAAARSLEEDTRGRE